MLIDFYSKNRNNLLRLKTHSAFHKHAQKKKSTHFNLPEGMLQNALFLHSDYNYAKFFTYFNSLPSFCHHLKLKKKEHANIFLTCD